MVQLLKTKTINVVPGQVFCRQCKAHCIDDQDKFQSVTDTDNEFSGCQTPRKKLQSIGILKTLNVFMKTLKMNILEAYKVQVDC